MTNDLTSRFASVKLLVLDVDGVMTDGGIYFGPRGETWRRFYAPDGLGIKAMARLGVPTAIVTGLESESVTHRAQSLGIDLLWQDQKQKDRSIREILARTKLDAQDLAFVGDDLIDLPALKLVGLPIAVTNAHPEVKAVARYITRKPGGFGAVREVCEKILEAQGKRIEF